MTEQEFNEKYGCLGKTLEDLPPDAIIKKKDGSIYIIEDLIPEDFWFLKTSNV